MKKRFILWYAVAVALGTGLHFLYDVLPNSFVGLFVPVNESVWEHLKLLYWPFLLTMAVLSRSVSDKHRFWGAALSGLLVMPPVLLSAYYVAVGAFGLESTAYDIVLYYLVMALGFKFAYSLNESGTAKHRIGCLVMLAGLYGVLMMVFTVMPPELPVFVAKT